MTYSEIMLFYLDELDAPNREMNGKIETYEESARTIALYLKDFCDESLPYPAMIADAARKASLTIDNLKEQQRMNYEQALIKIHDILAEWCDDSLPYPDNVIVGAQRVKQDLYKRIYWGESFEENHTENSI